MSYVVKNLTTSSTAQVLYPGPAAGYGVGAKIPMVITNEDATNAVRIGPATITPSAGLLIKAATTVTINWQDAGPLYVVAAAGAPAVSLLTVE